MRIPFPLLVLLAVPTAVRPQAPPDEFARVVRPILARNCSGCHKAGNARGPVDFLSAQTARDVESKRGVWRNVAAQLRNRTMPPAASNLTEQERLQVSTWIDQDLKRTACSGQEYAGWVTSRRLNRREYRNTVRDLLGVDLDVSEFFPEDGSGGEGFDTNGETLYLAPLLMERYLQAAHQILDRTIVTPALTKTLGGADFQGQASGVEGTRRTIAAGEEITGNFSVYADGMYGINLLVERSVQSQLGVTLKVDGVEAGALTFSRYESKGTTGGGKTVKLARGPHSISILAPKLPIQIITVTIAEKQQDPTPEKKALHYRLFGMEAGQTPLDSRKAAERLLAGVVRKAYRRPLQRGEIDAYLKLYDRAAERGDPYEERIKLAMTAVLVSPKFLFRVEDGGGKPGIHALTPHEVASRLSYFLWSTMPDEELSRLADEGKLQDGKVLSGQVDRMLNDPRSRVFAETFIGQWLGTKDVGFRVVPALNELHDFYTPEVAADLRQEPVLLFHYLLTENAPLLDLLDAKYSFLSDRLVKFYQLQGQVKTAGEDFQRVQWPDDRRGGVLGLGSVLAMTSHSKQTSPVLRGAWVLETLLGTKAPPPPPNIPPLDAAAHKGEKLTVREKLLRHRADASCATCHNLIDPIGFALENFDWMGRWRESENGRPVDASAVMPSGEKLNGPVELRKILLSRKSEFLQNLTSKVLGYALGRSLQDGDQCNVQKITQALEREHYGARTLVREVVLSVPFRNGQSGVEIAPAPAMVRRPRREVEK